MNIVTLMPWTNKETYDAIAALKEYYHTRSFLKRWFFPRDLAQALNRYPLVTPPNYDDSLPVTATAQQVIGCFFKPRYFVYYWFFPKLNFLAHDCFFPVVRQSPNRENKKIIIEAINLINQHDILTLDMAEKVMNHLQPKDLIARLSYLIKQGLLRGEMATVNYLDVIGHRLPFQLINALKLMDENGLLKGDTAEINRKAVVDHSDPVCIAKALIYLNNQGLLKGDMATANRNLVSSHSYPDKTAYVLNCLYATDLLQGKTGEYNRFWLKCCSQINELHYVFSHLDYKNILVGNQAQIRFREICKHAQSIYYTQVFGSPLTRPLTLIDWQKLVTLLECYENNRVPYSDQSCLNPHRHNPQFDTEWKKYILENNLCPLKLIVDTTILHRSRAIDLNQSFDGKNTVYSSSTTSSSSSTGSSGFFANKNPNQASVSSDNVSSKSSIAMNVKK